MEHANSNRVCGFTRHKALPTESRLCKVSIVFLPFQKGAFVDYHIPNGINARQIHQAKVPSQQRRKFCRRTPHPAATVQIDNHADNHNPPQAAQAKFRRLNCPDFNQRFSQKKSHGPTFAQTKLFHPTFFVDRKPLVQHTIPFVTLPFCVYRLTAILYNISLFFAFLRRLATGDTPHRPLRQRCSHHFQHYRLLDFQSTSRR